MAKTNVLLATQSAASNLTSGVQTLGDLQLCSFQVTFTGADVVGSLVLQGSIDGATFFDYPGSTQAVSASAGHIYDLNPTGVKDFRVKWTYTSGTGNITVISFLKENRIAGA